MLNVSTFAIPTIEGNAMTDQDDDIERIEWEGPPSERPTHPGQILKKHFLEPAGLTQADLARHIGREFKTINRLVNEHTRLTPDLAQRLAAAFQTTPDFWMNLQKSVDLYDARQSASDLPGPIVDRPDEFHPPAGR
jgi:addiction module HigA family antidote